MFVQQQTLLPQRNMDELRHLRAQIERLKGRPGVADLLEECVARHDALLAASAPRLQDYDPRAEQRRSEGQEVEA